MRKCGLSTQESDSRRGTDAHAEIEPQREAGVKGLRVPHRKRPHGNEYADDEHDDRRLPHPIQIPHHFFPNRAMAAYSGVSTTRKASSISAFRAHSPNVILDFG